MKKLFTLLTMLIVGIGSSWATDYSDSYYYISTSTQSHYGFYSAASGTRITTYGSTSAKTSAVLFKFIKTGTDDEYYWYNCTSKKYISVDASGNLLSADNYSDTDAYKWYIIDNGDGTVKITDKANYNSGSPSKALVTLGGNGSWWGVNDLSNETYTNKAWKLILAVEMKKSYYIALGRGENRYLQYSSDDNKMKQVVASTKDLSHVWYFTDEGDGVINIHPLTSSSAMGYASNASAGSDKISTTNATKTFKLTPTDATNYPIAFLASGLSSTLYISNNGGTSYANMGLYSGIADGGTRMRVEDARANAYIGATKTIGATEWKTQSNWVLGDTWNSNGPGYSSSNMWSPIYLNGVTATGIAFDGWALQLKLVNSSLTATTQKIQADGTLTIDVDEESKLDLTFTTSNNNPGTHIFNIDGALTINLGNNNWQDASSTNNINLGTTGSFTFTASSSKTIGANPSFTLNATLLDPGASYNTLVSRTLATFDKVTLTTLTTNISGVDGWTLVSSKEALEEQTAIGKYYYVEENKSSGVTLWMYKLQKYNVAEGEEETLSNIANYADYEEIYVPSNSTLNIDVAGFDLTKISGAGTVVLDADITVSGSKSTVATGKLTINEGKTLTLGTGQGQANSIASFTSIELAGTIKHNNSVATFNSVTVPTGKTGKIFAYDMGATSDGFKLAGTTTLVGDLVVCSKYNFQMKVDVLAGSGGCLICGTTGDNYDASGTSSNETATINIANALSYTGNATVNNSKATVNLAGNLVGSSWTKTNGTLNYAGNNLNGTTLDGVILSGTARINTSNTVNIKNLAGNNLNNTDHLYAFVGSGTINFYGTNDLTKKSDGSVCNSANIGYGSSASVTIKAGANVTAGIVMNSGTLSSNAPITVEANATLTTVGSTHADNKTILIYSTNLTNNGTINLNAENRASIVSALSGSGTINVASGANITTPSVPNAMTLIGAGDVILTSFPSSTAPTLTDWTGTITFPSPSENQNNLMAIFNAWGNTNSTIKLHSVSGWLPEGTVNPTLDILESETLTIRDGSSNKKPVLNKITGAGNLEQTWQSQAGSYALHIGTLTGFTGTLKGTYKPIVVKKLVLENAPNENDLLFKATGDVTLEKLFIDLQETTAYTLEKKIVDDVEGFYVVSIDLVQLARESAASLVTPYYNYIGTGVGKYTITLGLDKYTSIESFMEALNAWTTIYDYVVPVMTINQPEEGFYRFKAAARSTSDATYNWYMGGNANSIYSASTTDAKASDVNTIFYLEKDGNGYHPISYFSGLRSAGTAYHNVDDNSNFTLSQAIKEDNTTELLGEYKMVNGSNNTIVMWSDAYLRSLEDAQNNDWSGWTIEPVEEIPVTFKKSALGYATFFTPVPLQIPKNESGEYDIHAYVCKMDGTKLTFYDITNVEDEVGRIIPINTAVMLYNSNVKDGEDDEVVVNFTISSKDDVVIDNNSFYETLATVTPETLSTFGGKQHTIYSLRTKTKTDATKVMGFYERTSTSNCAGFKAWLMTEKEAQARNFTIYFDGEEAPTGIIEALGLQNDNVEIYDLNGRKLSSYRKGINIVNGKKVMVQ